MINYGRVISDYEPQEIEITQTAVFVAKDIVPYEISIDEYTISGYEYTYIEYSINEYILLLSQHNDGLQEELLDTQVALCDIWEALNDG